MKVIVYADTVKKARAFYPTKPNETVGYRAAGDFKETEKADLIMYAKEYIDIEAAYLAEKPLPTPPKLKKGK